MRAILTSLFVCLATVASAQMLPIQVLPDRVTIGAEFVPRRLDLPSRLVVPAGQTVELTDGAVLAYIEVAGTLRASRTHNTTVSYTHLIVLPGGRLDLGTAVDPLPSTVLVTLIERSVPIDLTKDPFQWGNGLVNFGILSMVTAARTPFCEMADTAVGATSLTLTCVPVGWRVGDDIRPLDTQTHAFPARPDIEQLTTIMSITGSTVGLSRPLAFAHQTVTGADGRLGVHPKVVNVTRTLVVRSENPLEVPGHLANIGDTACWDVEGAAFIGLGRTTVQPIDSTTADLTHLGTNQLGKYAFHNHHAHGACAIDRKVVDSVFIGQGQGKWGLVTHGTHDTLVQDNLLTGYPGAGLITEDGYEVRNRFLGNLGFYNLISFNDRDRLQSGVNFLNGQPGIEGDCGWFHGIMNTFDRNECWGNTIGLNLFGFHGKPGMYPSVPGGMPDTMFSPPYVNNNPPILVDHTVSVGNGFVGFETWGIEDASRAFDEAHLPVLDNIRSVNDFIGLGARQAEDVNEGWFRNLTVIQHAPLGPPDSYLDRYYGSRCVDITTGYVHPIKITGGYLSGCTTALWGVPNSDYLVSDTVVQGAVGVFWDVLGSIPFVNPPNTVFSSVTFLPYGTHAKRFVMSLYENVLWDGTGPSPIDGTAPPPPPPTPTWRALPGIFQQQLQPDPSQFRLCPDTSGTNCQAFSKQ